MDTNNIQPNREINPDSDLSEWLSTYGLITAERVLERYQIRLPRTELTNALKNPSTFYHRLILIPLKNIMNGIILQQAYDYQVYAQKLFIDYLLSDCSSKSDDSPGALTRDDLEQERQRLIQIGNSFSIQETAHKTLIAESQHYLIQLASEWENVLSLLAKEIQANLEKEQIVVKTRGLIQAITTLIILHNSAQDILKDEKTWPQVETLLEQRLDDKIKQQLVTSLNKLSAFTTEHESALSGYFDKIRDITIELGALRNQFYDLILRVTELLNTLPDYQIDSAQIEKNKEHLFFDREITGSINS